MYDYLIFSSAFYGVVFVHEAKEKRENVLVMDQVIVAALECVEKELA